MAVKMYKNDSFKKVRGMYVSAHLEDGWTFEPSKKSTAKTKNKIKVKEVDVIKPDLWGPEDLTTEE